MKTSTIVILSMLLGVGIIAAAIFLNPANTKGEELIPFAQCLKDEGAQFYGAFWCPHCQAQKALFGKAASSLPYTECSTPDGQGQLPVCDAKGVKSYPTWFFADGTKQEGEMTLEVLAAKTNCELPAGTATGEGQISVGGSSTVTSSSTASSTSI